MGMGLGSAFGGGEILVDGTQESFARMQAGIQAQAWAEVRAGMQAQIRAQIGAGTRAGLQALPGVLLCPSTHPTRVPPGPIQPLQRSQGRGSRVSAARPLQPWSQHAAFVPELTFSGAKSPGSSRGGGRSHYPALAVSEAAGRAVH